MEENDILELATELAHLRVKENFKKNYRIKGNPDTYTPEAQDYFDKWFDYYYSKFYKTEKRTKYTKNECAKYLLYYNKWRRGESETFECPDFVNETNKKRNIASPDPKVLGEIIDDIIVYLLNF